MLGALTTAPEEPAEPVESLYTAAMREYDAWGSPVFLARAQAAYGVWLTQRGRADEAEPVLAAARSAYAGLGATAWLEELEQALATHPAGSPGLSGG